MSLSRWMPRWRASHHGRSCSRIKHHDVLMVSMVHLNGMFHDQVVHRSLHMDSAAAAATGYVTASMMPLDVLPTFTSFTDPKTILFRDFPTPSLGVENTSRGNTVLCKKSHFFSSLYFFSRSHDRIQHVPESSGTCPCPAVHRSRHPIAACACEISSASLMFPQGSPDSSLRSPG